MRTPLQNHEDRVSAASLAHDPIAYPTPKAEPVVDLTRVMSVEHADSQCVGCVWHQDPACLCDVVITDPVGDEYDIPAGVVEAWSSWSNENDPDGWFDQAFMHVTWDTWRKQHDYPTPDRHGTPRWDMLVDVWGVVQNHPQLVQDLLNGASRSQVCTTYSVSRQVVTALAGLMNIAPTGKSAQGANMLPVRMLVLDLYDNHGYTAHECLHHVRGLGIAVKHPTLCKWIQRFSERYAVENPDKTLKTVKAGV